MRRWRIAMLGVMAAAAAALPPAPAQEQGAPEADAPEEAPGSGFGRKVVLVPVSGLISDVTLQSMQRRIAEAEEMGAEAVVFEIDTYGGLVTSALEISSYIKNLRVENVAWVNDKAISAGAMIAVACDRIVMTGRSKLGDCAPIAMGATLEGAERAKIESPILEDFRDSANRNGYSVTLTEAMVRLGPAVYMIERADTEEPERRFVFSTELGGYRDAEGRPLRPTAVERGVAPTSGGGRRSASPSGDETDLVRRLVEEAAGVERPEEEADRPAPQPQEPAAADASGVELKRQPGQWRVVKRVLGSGQLLTLSQDEALEYGFAERIVEDEAALAAYTNALGAQITRLETTWSEQLANWLASPAVRSVLMILFLLGAYLELQSPGVGLPGAVALLALITLVGAPYVAGLAGIADILVIALGVVLIAVEVFVLPGFGVAGVLGVLCLFGGLLMTFVQREPGPGWVPQLPGTWEMLQSGAISIVTALAVTCVGVYFLTKYFGSIPVLNRMVLTERQAAGAAARATPNAAPAAGAGGASEASSLSADGPFGVKPGDTGRALADLHPVGRADFGGRLVDVVTHGGWIEADRTVRVVEVHGNRVVVEEAEA